MVAGVPVGRIDPPDGMTICARRCGKGVREDRVDNRIPADAEFRCPLGKLVTVQGADTRIELHMTVHVLALLATCDCCHAEDPTVHVLANPGFGGRVAVFLLARLIRRGEEPW